MASIRKRGNTYQIVVSNGRDMNGKQLIETATFTPDPERTDKQNEKALQLFAMEFEKKVKDGKCFSGQRMTYSSYIDIWMKDYAEKQMEQTSYERCESAQRTIILPALGNMKLSAIKPLHIQKLYDNMLKNGYEKNGKQYSYNPNTVKRVHQIISSSLNTAVYWQLIEDNPCKRVKPPKVEKQVDVKHFTLEQAQAFLEYLDEPYTITYRGRQKHDGSPSDQYHEERCIPLQFRVFFNMALLGGFRRGELIALTWDDVDYAHNTVEIRKSAARVKDGIIIKAPKTFSSNRIVTLPADCMKLLKRLEIQQKEYRLQVGEYWKGEGHIFTQDDGSIMDISTPNKVFKKIIRRYNEDINHHEKLPEITLHGLRHTSATLLIAQNIDVKTVSGRLGHSETSTTMDIYAHALKKRDEEAAASLDILFKKHG